MNAPDSHNPVPRRHFDVVVVGARAAGAATAMLLARQGLSTLVLDRSRAGSDTLSTHALMRGGVMQLNRWGLLDEVIAAGTPAVRRTVFTYGTGELDIKIKAAHGVDALYAPRRTVLDPMLVRAAVRAGAVVRHGARVIDVIERDGRVRGVVATIDGSEPIEITARLVIGADGVRSTVADLVGAPFVRKGEHQCAVTYGYWSGWESEAYEWIFRNDAAAGVIPTNNGQACVFVSASAKRIGRGGRGVIADILGASAPAIAARLERAVPPSGTHTWGGMHGFMRQAHGPGWALVGDAGYFKDPISAHGLTDALRDAELLARNVVAGFGADDSEAEALAEYQATRDHLSVRLFDVVDRIASHQWSDEEIAALLIELAASMGAEIDALAELEPAAV